MMASQSLSYIQTELASRGAPSLELVHQLLGTAERGR